jgi:prepilin-type N-terminal cleavage/methylation domain-containing protein
MAALRARATRSFRSQDGFGLVELTIAMAMMAIALLVLVAALSSGEVTLQRAGAAGTAGTLADRQMEKYRAMKYASIMLDATATTTASSDSVYNGDSAYSATQVTGTCTLTSWPDPCNPKQTPVTGPDNHKYRVDTYITSYTPTGGRALKVITVVVRNPNHLTGPALARLQSRFDVATGS